MKKLLIFHIFSILSLSAMEIQPECELKIARPCIQAPSKLGDIELYRNHKKKFYVIQKNGTSQKVHKYDVDPTLHQIDNEQLAQLLIGNRIRVNQLSNQDYTLALEGGLKGGGVVGATAGFWLGKATVHLVAHGTIWAVSFVAGPAAPVVASVLSSTLAVPIEALSNVVGIGTAITGGTITGPV